MKKLVKIYNLQSLEEKIPNPNYVPISGSFTGSSHQMTVIGYALSIDILYPEQDIAQRFDARYIYNSNSIEYKFICNISKEDYDFITKYNLEKEYYNNESIDLSIKELCKSSKPEIIGIALGDCNMNGKVNVVFGRGSTFISGINTINYKFP